MSSRQHGLYSETVFSVCFEMGVFLYSLGCTGTSFVDQAEILKKILEKRKKGMGRVDM